MMTVATINAIVCYHLCHLHQPPPEPSTVIPVVTWLLLKPVTRAKPNPRPLIATGIHHLLIIDKQSWVQMQIWRIMDLSTLRRNLKSNMLTLKINTTILEVWLRLIQRVHLLVLLK